MAKVSDDDMALMGRLLGRGEAGEKGAARIAALLDALNESESKLGESQIRVAALEAQVRKLLDARVCEECEWPVGSEQHKQHCPEAIRG